MSISKLETIVQSVAEGTLVPYLGPGVLAEVRNETTGEPMPAGSDSLIIAMNNGRPMAPKLMYEFPRAAMNLELKRGRRFIEQFLTKLYRDNQWSRAALHDWLRAVKPPYVIDINRDTQLQDSYRDTPHLLIRGIARIGGTQYRFTLQQYDGNNYHEVDPETADSTVPVLFKPSGSPLPTPSYIASDADYVDYITELMGGFGLPAFLKTARKGKQYLFLGMRFSRDTERMVMSDIIYDASEPVAGYALIEEPNDKERRFLAKKGVEIVEASIADLVACADTSVEAL